MIDTNTTVLEFVSRILNELVVKTQDGSMKAWDLHSDVIDTGVQCSTRERLAKLAATPKRCIQTACRHI